MWFLLVSHGRSNTNPSTPQGPPNRRQKEIVKSLQLVLLECLCNSDTKIKGHLWHFEILLGISCGPSTMCIGRTILFTSHFKFQCFVNKYLFFIDKLQIFQDLPVYQKIEKYGKALYSNGWSVGRSVVCSQRWGDTTITLASGDVKVIPSFSREDTYLWDISGTSQICVEWFCTSRTFRVLSRK